MRRAVLITVTVGGLGLPLLGGTALASAGDDRRTRTEVSAREVAGPRFELEIDPELDARFGPRPVNAAQAAAVVADRFPGARVTEAELDERDGGPIWEMKFSLGGREREVEVDAVTAVILDGDRNDDDSGDD